MTGEALLLFLFLLCVLGVWLIANADKFDDLE
jgi:hypothetical protein